MLHIIDISRIISLEQIDEVEPEQKEDQESVDKKTDKMVDENQPGTSLIDSQPEKPKETLLKSKIDLQLMPGANQTNGTATLNVLQVQRASFNEQ